MIRGRGKKITNPHIDVVDGIETICVEVWWKHENTGEVVKHRPTDGPQPLAKFMDGACQEMLKEIAEMMVQCMLGKSFRTIFNGVGTRQNEIFCSVSHSCKDIPAQFQGADGCVSHSFNNVMSSLNGFAPIPVYSDISLSKFSQQIRRLGYKPTLQIKRVTNKVPTLNPSIGLQKFKMLEYGSRYLVIWGLHCIGIDLSAVPLIYECDPRFKFAIAFMPLLEDDSNEDELVQYYTQHLHFNLVHCIQHIWKVL